VTGQFTAHAVIPDDDERTNHDKELNARKGYFEGIGKNLIPAIGEILGRKRKLNIEDLENRTPLSEPQLHQPGNGVRDLINDYHSPNYELAEKKARVTASVPANLVDNQVRSQKDDHKFNSKNKEATPVQPFMLTLPSSWLSWLPTVFDTQRKTDGKPEIETPAPTFSASIDDPVLRSGFRLGVQVSDVVDNRIDYSN
jgi:hypothetical protein